MRSPRHMHSMLAVAAAMATVGIIGEQSKAPRLVRANYKYGLDPSTGKPPMNGKREVARRLKQIERGDTLNHPTVRARTLVFPA